MGICEVIDFKETYFMYHDEIFEKALQDVKEESYKALKDEISTMEMKIEKFLKCVLESSASRAERDFNISAV
jgi:hypothetical protein